MRWLFLILLSFVSVVNAGWVTENDLNVNRWPHVKVATVCYSANDINTLGYIARNYDLILMHSTEAWFDTVYLYNDSIRLIRYITNSSFRPEDIDTIPGFASDRSWTSAQEDSLYLWVEGDSTVIRAMSFGTCTEADTTRSLTGDTVTLCGWSDNRAFADFRFHWAWDYFTWKPFWRMDYYSGYDGIFEDEANYFDGGQFMILPLRDHLGEDSTYWVNNTSWQDVNGWDTENWQEVTDSMDALFCDIADGSGSFHRIVDTCYAENRAYFQNVTNYCIIHPDRTTWGRIKWAGTGISMWETNISQVNDYLWLPYAWDIMDSIIVWDTGYALVHCKMYNSDISSLDSLERVQMANYVWFHMAADEKRFYCMINGGEPTVHRPDYWSIADTLDWKFFPAIGYNIGVADGSRSICSSGTDGVSQSFNIYKREFTRSSDNRNFMMLYRGREGSNYGVASKATYDLGSNWHIINADSSLSSLVSSIDILNVHGVMLMEDTVTSASKNSMSRIRFRK